MRLPIGDPQFWIVSAIALFSLLMLVRRLGVLGARKRRRERKVRLTVRGQEPRD